METKETAVDYVLVDFEPLHKQRWRSDTIRLVCAEFPPYTTCLWHQHLKYGIYVVMAPLDVVEQPYGEKSRPLVQSKGAVFCRDHTKDKLIHAATTNELPAFIIEVELLKEKEDVIPNGNLPLHAGNGIELLNNEPECRVYRFTLQDKSCDDYASTQVSLTLPTEAVLLALEECEVEITSTLADTLEDSVHQLSLNVGDDVHLDAGTFKLKLVSSGVKETQFVLAEVF
ncbi:hypothetical protein KRP22_002327 [Phytophthora ramorum]|uniref:Uncharacterized protein n=1 Tax=Phytophthora ramorum TaxID=164328 RepID=H3GLE6_PHYRM|nr:hypothetical protein KRP23_1011 [Phytophthora ramorum]KAH7510117.1 hypothetical protein KRP22_1610 [Phytophthora ramorum]